MNDIKEGSNIPSQVKETIPHSDALHSSEDLCWMYIVTSMHFTLKYDKVIQTSTPKPFSLSLSLSVNTPSQPRFVLQ